MPTWRRPYSRGDLAGKAACRADLLARIGFDASDPGPVIGMIGRLDPQKGFDLLSDAAPALLKRGVRLVVQGSGDPALAGPFRALAAANPERVALIERFDRAMARRIYAGADFFAMPSRFEPCGQGQMIALRYGTPPIVHRTGGPGRHGGRRDRRNPGRGTGFSFGAPTSTALVGACEAAVAPVRGPAVRRGPGCWIAGWRSTSTGRPAPRRGTSRPTGARSRSGPRADQARACSRAWVVCLGWVRCGACGAPGERDHVVRPDEPLEGRDRRVRDVPAGSRIGPDEPGRDARGGRIGEVGEPAVPVAVLEQDGTGGLDIELDQRLGLGLDVAVGPGRIGGTEPGDRLGAAPGTAARMGRWPSAR